jgi:hypothetical protein
MFGANGKDLFLGSVAALSWMYLAGFFDRWERRAAPLLAQPAVTPPVPQAHAVPASRARVISETEVGSPLWKAIEAGNVTQAVTIVSKSQEYSLKELGLCFRQAAYKGLTEVVVAFKEKIRALDLFATDEHNYALRFAARSGHTATVNALLEIDSVRKQAGANNNQALMFAAEHAHTEILLALLKTTEVLSNLTLSNCSRIVHCMNGHISRCSNKQSALLMALEVIKNYFVIMKSYLQYFMHLRSRPGHLATLANLKESALNGEIVLRGKSALKSLERVYEEQFETHGSSELERIKNIESQVRSFLLDKIQAQKNTSSVIQDFIKKNYGLLIEGDKESVHSLTELLSGIDEHEQINVYTAWCALDSKAPTGVRINFMVEPDQAQATKHVFVTSEAWDSSDGLPTLEVASLLSRRKLAYCYLAVTDVSLDVEHRQRLEQGFINYLAEIRKTNEEDLATKGDSCYPGVLSRLGTLILSHPRFESPMPERDTLQEIDEAFKTKMEEVFKSALSDYPTDRSLALYDAIVWLHPESHSFSALYSEQKDYYSLCGATHFNRDLLGLRKEFNQRLLKALSGNDLPLNDKNICGGIDSFLNSLFETQESETFGKLERAYANYLFFSLGGVDMAPRLNKVLVESNVAKFSETFSPVLPSFTAQTFRSINPQGGARSSSAPVRLCFRRGSSPAILTPRAM